ncbi:MAG: glycoside hydrolase family 3 N-terminal domain-containing protein [Cyclobacteriaceae bacterium]|nr:glycoside hydrolase family 3 N-terminal domain-containing protein [Cyclobacteriaceae bacterium]
MRCFLLLTILFACKTLTAQDSLDIKIGQMILIGFPKAEVDATVLEEVRKGKAGSIILFEKNIPKSGSAFIALKKIIWTYQQAAPIPLLVTIDQEGGRVNRLKDRYGFPRTITAWEMGRSDDSTRFYAEAIAATLAGLGINVNLAPCVDLGVNPSNTVIYGYGRAFSSHPDTVAKRAATFIRAHRNFNVLTVMKHFPGHGSSLADSHYGMADVTKTWTEAELLPYRSLIGQGLADAIMTAHIVNRQLDPKGLPGTLSSRMVDSLLRKQMNFNGVVFSDDMQMQAITRHYGLEEAIRLAIQAGVDILCFSNNIPDSEERTVDKVHRIIRSLVDRGVISEQRIDQSFRRILQLKRRLHPEIMPAAKTDIKMHSTANTVELDALRQEVKELRSELKKLMMEEKKPTRRKKQK